MCGEVGGKGSFREKTKLLILEETEKMGRGPFTLLAYLSYLSLKERGEASRQICGAEKKKAGSSKSNFPILLFFNVPFFPPTLQDFGVDRLALHRLSRLEARADSLRAAQQRGE